MQQHHVVLYISPYGSTQKRTCAEFHTPSVGNHAKHSLSQRGEGNETPCDETLQKLHRSTFDPSNSMERNETDKIDFDYGPVDMCLLAADLFKCFGQCCTNIRAIAKR